MMIGNLEAIEYAETMLPDMISGSDDETCEYYEKFCNRVRYLCNKDVGKKAKYHKYNSRVGGYWTCGNCGTIITEVHNKYCCNCGYKLKGFPNYGCDKGD